MLPEFELLRPSTLGEALTMLGACDVMPVAGGTNVIADLRAGKHHPKALVDLGRLAELRGVGRDDGHLVIGGGTTITDLLNSPLVAEHAPALCAAASVFANPLIRNRATVGGNLVDASPAADTAPPLLALSAEVELASAGVSRRVPLVGQFAKLPYGVSRRVPLEDFLVGVRKTLCQPDELLTAIRCPVARPRSASAFYKVGLRKSDAISVLSVAVAVECDDAGRCIQARIALGAVAPRPFRASAAEAVLRGQPLTLDAIAEAAHLAAETARPISDIRGSAAYRRQVTQVVVRRLLLQVAQTANHSQSLGERARPASRMSVHLVTLSPCHLWPGGNT